MTHQYILALGSNRRHGRFGAPHAVLAAAAVALAEAGIHILRTSRTIDSVAIGPTQRRYANMVLLVQAMLPPQQMLAILQRVERGFGRRRARRWGPRVIDIDIILWSGGRWQSPTLNIPHPRWHERDFVAPLVAQLAPEWRAGIAPATPRQIGWRLGKRRGGEP
ncbi:MAG: 2-amino-4-hydroxy-6-hydroxymethyldihydropteridine diphosphokinase [Sphingomonadaceae bacterium]|nr:2-amino-4-hydroxy-6-hydroxymethyldihydropteridine diphosphokinase [Sphingomonadaceae bacterium]